jgi:hypothetical protein
MFFISLLYLSLCFFRFRIFVLLQAKIKRGCFLFISLQNIFLWLFLLCFYRFASFVSFRFAIFASFPFRFACKIYCFASKRNKPLCFASKRKAFRLVSLWTENERRTLVTSKTETSL